VVIACLAASSCGAQRSGGDRSLQNAARALRNGNATAALEIVRAAEHRYQPGSEDGWSAHLLEAEILLRDDQLAAAGQVLSAEPPQGARFAGITARRVWLLGEFELSRGDADAAEAYLQRAGRMAEAAGAWDVAFETQASTAKLLFVFRRDARKATELFQELTDAAARRQAAYYQAVALLGLGMIRLKESRCDEAIPWFHRAMEAARRDAAQRLIVAAGQNLAICYSQLGSFDEALKSRQDAVNLLGNGGLVPYRMQLLGEMGSTYLLQDEVSKAIDFYRRALALARTEADTARWQRTLAAAYVVAQDWDAAEQSNNQSITHQNDDASRPWVEKNAAAIAEGRGKHTEAAGLYRQAIDHANGDPVIIWESHAALADTYAKARNFPRANREFEEAIDIIDRNVDKIATQSYKLTFFSMLIRFYQSYVRALVEQQAYDRALEVADSSRARILHQQLALAKSTSAPMTRHDYRRLAGATGSVLLFYWIAPQQSYLWVVTSNGIHRPFELPPAEQIRHWVDQYRDFIEQQVGDPISGRGEAGRQLYQALIAPAASLIPRGSRVILVPDDALNWLNLETLPVPNGDKPHYWIEDAVSMIAPSLSALNSARQPQRQPPDSLLIVGDPVPPGPEFPKLEYAAKEIETIETKFPAANRAKFAGPMARPSIYKTASPGRYALLHFSAHAVANKESPLDSAIILSAENDNFKLYARDIMDTPLTANLVTISACRSAGARTYRGEGLVGFAWGFLQAGARNVIAGLWDVTDSSTPEMMGVLYSRIAKGDAPAEGLRDSKLALIRSETAYRKPYYWGPLQVYGRGF
jgi:CHAT domain-containing protein